MEFREASAEEIPQLAAVRAAFLQETFGAVPEGLPGELERYFRAHLGRDLWAFVCVQDGEILSSVLTVPVEKPPNPTFPNGRTGTVLNVYTRPDSRRRGIAKELMRLTIQRARQEGLSCLDLKATALGEPLYRTLGFTPDASGDLPMTLQIAAPECKTTGR